MDIGKKLANLRKEAGLSQLQVAKYLCEQGQEIKYKSVSAWERGNGKPNAICFLLLCKLYGVQNMGIFYQVEQPNYPELNDAGRKKLKEYETLLLLDTRYVKKPIEDTPKRFIPLYDLPVSAGTGQFLDSDRYEMIEAKADVPLDATFAVKVNGDSMEPRYANGQILYIRQQPTLEEGEIGIFMLNGDAYCKKLVAGTLVSLNPDYKPIPISEADELRVYGKVVG